LRQRKPRNSCAGHASCAQLLQWHVVVLVEHVAACLLHVVIATMLVAEFIVRRIAALGVRHVFGVGGANIEDMFSAVQRRRPELRAVLCKHEHGAGTAADAYARLRGLGVVMTTSGGGAMNLVHSLAEARASGDPLLAIVGEPPTDLQGNGAFQDTSGKHGAIDAQAVFRAVARCARVESAEALPRLLDEAVEGALGRESGPSVLLLSKDIQRAALPNAQRPEPSRLAVNHEAALLDEEVLVRAARWLEVRPIVILAGAGLSRARAQKQLAALAERLDARVATTPDGRDAFDNRAPRFLGVCGAMGHPSVARTIANARAIVVVGTRLPILARQGIEAHLLAKPLVSLGRDAPFVTGAQSVHLGGPLPHALSALLAHLRERQGGAAPLDDEQAAPALISPSVLSLTSTRILKAIERLAPENSVLLVDAGNTGASAIHHVRATRGGSWLMAMGMAGMGYTFGAALGAACATGRRCIVVAGDGAFFMHGAEIHTAVQYSLPITFVILDNRAHGMCLVRERLLLGENASYNAFGRSHIGAGLAAMFPGLHAVDCADPLAFERQLEAALAADGPSVLCAALEDVEIPPFVAFQERAPDLTRVAREADHVGETGH
jgi:acetolactate synthase-1/2/3 large subunit